MNLSKVNSNSCLAEYFFDQNSLHIAEHNLDNISVYTSQGLLVLRALFHLVLKLHKFCPTSSDLKGGFYLHSELTSRSALHDVLPTVLGYIGIGIAFGIVSRAAGISVLITLLISTFVYAGSAQFVLITMLVNHSPLLSIVFSIFLVNARMMLMSTTLSPYFKQEPTWKNILLGTFLTDESFALGMNKLNYTNRTLGFTWLNTVNLAAYLTWLTGTGMGALLGSLITEPNKFGFQFAITAMFIGLLYLQVISDKTIQIKLQVEVILFVLLLTYFGMAFIPGNLLILVVTLLGCMLGVSLKHAHN